jgi:hypothetical protein
VSAGLAHALAKLEDASGWEGVAHDKDAPPDLRIQISIAISLKRIADAICGDTMNSGLKDLAFDLAERHR